jgi:uncharacterized membrane protein
MPHFETYYLVKWLHLVMFTMGGGTALIILILTGFEEQREDLRGLSSVLWRRTTAWAFRLAVLLGLALLVLRFTSGEHPFEARYLHWKLVLVALLLLCSELSPKALGRNRRGSALLTLVLFLMVAFVSVNHDAFGTLPHHPAGAAGHYSGAAEQGSE